MKKKKILIVQLLSNGDCLFVTTIARQIKEVDYPDCHLTWMIASRCKQVLINNPHVDEVIEIPVTDNFRDRQRIPELIQNTGQSFDKIIITENAGENIKYFYGTFRMGYFRTYDKEITVPIAPVIALLPEEIANVTAFAEQYSLNDKNYYNVLVECGPLSEQSRMNIDMALKIFNFVSHKKKNIKFILSCKKIDCELPTNVFDGSVLSWRENAELTKYCDLLIGCSSGITWIGTSTWAKELPMLQIINQDYGWKVTTASVEYDFMYWGLNRDNLIELDDKDEHKIMDCAHEIITNSVAIAKKKYPGREAMTKEQLNAYFAEHATRNFFAYIHSTICPDLKQESPQYIKQTFKLLCFLIARKIYLKSGLKALRNRNLAVNKLIIKLKDVLSPSG